MTDSLIQPTYLASAIIGNAGQAAIRESSCWRRSAYGKENPGHDKQGQPFVAYLPGSGATPFLSRYGTGTATRRERPAACSTLACTEKTSARRMTPRTRST
jgi:hypothetical protein